MIIEIPDRLYNDISSWCHANEKLPVQWYILHSLNEKFMTDKYGDLNQKMNKTEEPIRVVATNEETHIVSQEPLTEEVRIQENYEVSKPNEFPEAMDVLKKDKKEITKKRQLKTR